MCSHSAALRESHWRKLPSTSDNAAIWLVRVCFTIVFVWNVLCAVQFIGAPAPFVGAYQLSGIAGEAAIRGMGVVFLMWNATYPLFIYQPARFKVLGAVIVAQQLIGCVGEGVIWASLPSVGYEVLASSILRFMAFDATGLGLMLISSAFCLCRRKAH